MKKKMAVLLALLLLCLPFAGCARDGDVQAPGDGSPPPAVSAEPPDSPEISPPAPSADENTDEYADIEHLYTIPIGDIWWTVDQNGNTVDEVDRSAGDYSWTLTDIFTGEKRYIMRARLAETQIEGEEPRQERALFDADGEQLTDWNAECDYESCFGNFVLSRSYSAAGESVVIFDVTSGETVFDIGAGGYIQPFGEMVFCGTFWKDLNGYSSEYTLLDREGKVAERIEVPSGSDVRFLGACLYIMSGSEVVLAIDSSGNDLSELAFFPYLVSSENERHVFYADKRVFIRSEEYDDATGIYPMALFDSETGEQIGEPFWQLEVNRLIDDGGPAFYGVRDSRAVIVDENGAVIRESEEIEGLRYLTQVAEGVYAFETFGGVTETSSIPAARFLDENLDLIPIDGGEEYGYFRIPEGGETAGADFIVGERNSSPFPEAYNFGPGSGYFVDILSLSGEVIVKNLRSVFEVGPGRFAVARGYDAGLMDWEGNWIVRRSVFNQLED